MEDTHGKGGRRDGRTRHCVIPFFGSSVMNARVEEREAEGFPDSGDGGEG